MSADLDHSASDDHQEIKKMNRSRWTTVALALACCIALPHVGAAAPLIIATEIVPGCDGTTPIVTITLDATTYGYYVDGLYYHFDPPSPGTLKKGSNPVVVSLPPDFAPSSSHVAWISTSAAPTGGSSSKEYEFTAPDCRPKSMGMTWKRYKPIGPTGVIRVRCDTGHCDAYHGDTSCNVQLPILCIRESGDGFPLSKPANVDNSDKYNRWSGGVVGTTAPTVPPDLLSEANDLCRNEFGKDWRVAEFHDGWGWGFQAYGGVGDPDGRFWVNIKNQPANCWKQQ